MENFKSKLLSFNSFISIVASIKSYSLDIDTLSISLITLFISFKEYFYFLTFQLIL